MQKKKVKLSKSAKGALLYMLVVLSIFAVLETVVCSLPSYFDESNTEAYTGTLSHVEKYTTWHNTHVTSDMQTQACGIVGGFMEDIFGKELKPWQESEKPETEP